MIATVHSIEYRSTSELNIRCDNQEIPLRFYCPTLSYCIPDSPPLVFILNQLIPVYILLPYYFKIHFNNILFFCGLIFQARHSLQVYGTEIFRGFMIPAMPPSHSIPLNRIKLRDSNREGYVIPWWHLT
jgi:hypothetical protein